MSDAGDAPEVGPLAEEAAKLFGALSGWAREHAGEASDGLSGLAAQAASAVHGIDEHLATGAAECTVCPLCRTVHAVRQLSPEVKAHLTSCRRSSLAQAAAACWRRPSATPRPATTSSTSPVDDEWPEDKVPGRQRARTIRDVLTGVLPWTLAAGWSVLTIATIMSGAAMKSAAGR